MDPSCLVSSFLAGGDGLIVWELFCWHTMGIMVLELLRTFYTKEKQTKNAMKQKQWVERCYTKSQD